MTCNTAVFYDVENLISLFNTKGNKTLQLDEIHRRILALDVVHGISVQKAYADWAQQVNRNLRSYVLQIGIEPVQIFNTNQNDKVKNAADVSLIIDAVELLVKRPEIENYVIASGDGIFAFLAKKLHEYGKRVIGCGFERNSNIIFKNACDIFLPLEKSDNSLTAVVKNFNKGTILAVPAEESEPPVPAPQQPVTQPPAPQELKIPNKLPKNKFSEVLVQSDIQVWKNARNLSGSLHIMKRMVNTLFDWTDEDIDLEISLFKAYLAHYQPNFRLGQYGFKRIGEFMRFLVTSSPYCLVISEGTVLRIARRNVPRDKDDVLMDDIPHLLFTLNDGTTAKSLFDIEEDAPFTFSMEAPTPEVVAVVEPEPEPEPELKPPAPKQGRRARAESAEIMKSEPVKSVKPESAKSIKPESIRKQIKNTFTRLSQENKLTPREVKRLLNEDYSQKIFGVKVPVYKELRTRSHLRDQRTVDGKVVYWKDEFKFNGKSYLIFKEWTDRQHRAKFEAWLEKIEK